jgi:hypothetical protein
MTDLSVTRDKSPHGQRKARISGSQDGSNNAVAGLALETVLQFADTSRLKPDIMGKKQDMVSASGHCVADAQIHAPCVTEV